MTKVVFAVIFLSLFIGTSSYDYNTSIASGQCWESSNGEFVEVVEVTPFGVWYRFIANPDEATSMTQFFYMINDLYTRTESFRKYYFKCR